MRNAHPLIDSKKRVALIHNGIIENFLEIKHRLLTEGWEFVSDTDTEVIANLVSSYLEGDLREAVARAVAELEGLYAMAVVSTLASADQQIVVARQGPPLVLGRGEGEMYLASDPAALLAHTRDVTFLENGDVARMTTEGIEIWDAAGDLVERPVTRLAWDPIQVEKGGYRHFMLKEIHEQPQAVQDTLAGRVDFETGAIDFGDFSISPEAANRLVGVDILACGTSWHAGLVGKFFIEELVRLPVEVDYGSEYRYRDPLIDDRYMALGISQSGETADTLSAMEAARERGASLFGICNVVGSQVTRICEGGSLHERGAGDRGRLDQGVHDPAHGALSPGALPAPAAAGTRSRGRCSPTWRICPRRSTRCSSRRRTSRPWPHEYSRAENFLYLGRGLNYPVALEGALKLKEISYIHAEGYPAGEMKHGPIALIDESMPIVAIATGERVYDKMRSNMQEAKARGGVILALTDRDPGELESVADAVIPVPRVSELLQPIVNTVPCSSSPTTSRCCEAATWTSRGTWRKA